MSRSYEDARARDQAADAERERRKAIIRHFNDQLRMLFAGGLVMITPGVRALDQAILADVTRAVCRFADFDPDNDPYDEHDFGAVEVRGVRVFWKIDCYDKTMEFGSPDPTDPDVTARVLTIMLAEEY